MFKSLNAFSHLAPLVLRVGLGFMFIVAHGWPKLSGGPDRWTAVGNPMKNIGIEFAPQFWGLMAAGTEFFGGILLCVGLLVRPVSAMLIFVMFIATLSTYARTGSLLGGSAHPIEVGIAFIALLLLGAGKYSLDKKMGLS